MHKTLSGEVIADGVTVNIVSPSAVRTDRTRSTVAWCLKGISGNEELPRVRNSRPPVRHAGRIDAMVAFIASDRASYTTGVNIRVDGGSAKGLARVRR